jgi:hypothetical protein
MSAMATFSTPLNFEGTTKIKGKHFNSTDAHSKPHHISIPSSLETIGRNTNTLITDKTDREQIIAAKNGGDADPVRIPPSPEQPHLRAAATLPTSLLTNYFLQENKDSHRRTRFTDQSNIRVAGGKAAGPKPIKANYDADDARIVDLKQQGWSDEYVARKLAEEGRIRYVGRTVGSRWLRIRKALEAKEEEILEDEMSDWHDGEVCFQLSPALENVH